MHDKLHNYVMVERIIVAYYYVEVMHGGCVCMLFINQPKEAAVVVSEHE